MRSSDSEVAMLCPSHHQGETSDIHFHISVLKCSKKKKKSPSDQEHKWISLKETVVTRLLLPEGGTFPFRLQLDHQKRSETDALFDSVPASQRLLGVESKLQNAHRELCSRGVCGANTWTCPQKKPRVALPTAIPQKRHSKLNQVRTCQRGEVKSGNT